MFGSVFLGDPRQRILASTSPPSSPLPHGPPHISPEVALQLRIRWLEALLLGVNEVEGKSVNKKSSKTAGASSGAVTPVSATRRKPVSGEEEADDADMTDEEEPYSTDENTLIRQAEEIQRRLDAIVEKYDDLAMFIQSYLDALLQEMEPEIREADRSLASIIQLEKQGVTSAGKLEEYEPLLPRLAEVVKKHKEDTNRFDALESRLMGLLERYNERVGIMSELFVQWNDTIRDAEADIVKLEKELAKRQEQGLQ
ncbi:SubName: Full=Uncharacterized protein {ECO:0000313/EMBL:CCA73036.1} [Serendipita indica DSM 11827]|nr:SubName: Full=Uncharacterized protein {ECO:0000313/EMBL:CCA73036.1} [Serendipita indica DSM 11827]